jgi:hypothetical protein
VDVNDISCSLRGVGLASGESAVEDSEGSSQTREPAVSHYRTATRTRRRIVLLEGPWEGAKTLAKQLLQLREELHLPPLPYLTLPEGITGRYWRLQHVGSSAVSTIEAIAHVAWCAVYVCAQHKNESLLVSPVEGMEEADKDAAAAADRCRHVLLLLFNLQRYRVFESLKTGKRVPIAMATSHSGGFETFWDGYMRRHNIASYISNFSSS